MAMCVLVNAMGVLLSLILPRSDEFEPPPPGMVCARELHLLCAYFVRSFLFSEGINSY
jgi:hypothetical protein